MHTVAIWVHAGAGVIACVAGRATRMRPGRAGPSAACVEHLGFNVIALVDGFVVVAALRSGAPVWVVIGVGAGVVAAGHVAIRLARRRLVRAARAPVAARA